MKKSLVALAVLAAAGAASAQSSVTLYGVVDAGISNFKLGGVSVTKMTTSNNTSSQLGFRGTEDLGGGMTANFWLEAALINDSGNFAQTNTNNQGTGASGGGGLVFARRSTMSLAGNFGEVRLGRDYTPTFWNYTVFDPYGTLGAAAGSNVTLIAVTGGGAVRASNSVQYLYGFAPNAQSAVGTGVYAQAMYAMGENNSAAANKNDGQYTGIRVGYAQGPINAALAYAKDKNLAVGDYTYTNIGASYDLGVAKLMGLVATAKTGGTGAKYNTWELGATVPVGAGYIPVSYSAGKLNDAINSKTSQLGIGYVYNLSKRTAVYTALSRINNSTGALATFSGGNGSSSGLAAATGTGTGFDLGLKHSF